MNRQKIKTVYFVIVLFLGFAYSKQYETGLFKAVSNGAPEGIRHAVEKDI